MQSTHTLPYFIVRNDRVDWAVSGLFDKDKFIIDIMNIITKEFELPNPIASVYGAPPIAWNDEFITGGIPKTGIDETLAAYAKAGVAVFATFTNPSLTKKDLDEVSGNYLLEKLAENKNNGVVVSSDILAEYIRNKFPALKLKNSLVKISAPGLKRDKAFYENLAKTYDRVVIHPSNNLDFELLNALEPKDKFEIIVNNGCIYGCPHYVRCHTKSNDILSYDLNKKFVIENCVHYERQVHTQKGDANEKSLRNQNLTLEELDKIIALGFKHFNLQGRAEPLFPFLYDFTRYVLEPDFAAPLIFKIML